MAKLNVNNLSWGQRFALIDAFKLTDTVAVEKLGVTVDQLKIAKEQREKGVFSVDTTFNVTQFDSLFNPTAKKESTVTKHKATVDGAPRKRGRQGSKIMTAFNAIGNTPMSVEQFTKQHNVSLAVLRQSKRFDKTGLPGIVHVKKKDGVLMVWREATSATKA